MKLFTLLETSFNQFTTAIKSYLSKTLSMTNSSFGNNTIFGQMINVLSAVTQNIMLYIEDAMVEQNKYTAQRKKSIYGLAALTGYKPFLGKATGVQLAISYMPNNYSDADVIINNHESFTCTQNGLKYNLILPQEIIVMSLSKDTTTKYVYAVQGKFETQRFISSGGKYYTQNIKYLGNLDADYITVKVNNETWEYADSLYDMTADGKQWTYRVGLSGGIDILFGNDAHGRSLKNEDVVEISYLVHDGELGNLDVDAETYFIFNDSLKSMNGDEIDGNGIFNVTFATNDAVTSGTNSEDLQQVKEMIGYNSRSLVLSDVNNYKVFLNRFAFCGYNRTWTEPGSMVINSLIVKNHKLNTNEGRDYFTLTENDFLLTPQQKQSIITCVENSGQQMAGTTYRVFNPVLCKYAAFIFLKMKNVSYNPEYVKLTVRNLVGNFFNDIESDIFIPKSDIIQLIKNEINEVDSVDVYFLSEKNETAMQRGWYENNKYKYNPSLGLYEENVEKIDLYPGENPQLGLDNHGNIYLPNDTNFPILMGGWDYLNNEGQEVMIMDPLNIVIETL